MSETEFNHELYVFLMGAIVAIHRSTDRTVLHIHTGMAQALSSASADSSYTFCVIHACVYVGVRVCTCACVGVSIYVRVCVGVGKFTCGWVGGCIGVYMCGWVGGCTCVCGCAANSR